MNDKQLPADAFETLAQCVRGVVARQRTDPNDRFFTWTHDYGEHGDVHLVVPAGPPAEWDVGAVRVTVESQPTYHVIVAMWTVEEGRSDLSLIVEVRRQGASWVAEPRDLDVL